MQPQNVHSSPLTRITAIALLALVTSCSQAEPPQATDVTPQQPTPTAVKPAKPPASTQAAAPKSSPVASPQPDPFPQAVDTAMGAATITQSAVSPDDWNLVVKQWQQAIALLKSVPASHPKKALANQKIGEYQRNLAYAKQQAITSARPIISPSPTLVASQPTTAQVEPPPVVAPPLQPTTPSTSSSSVSANVALAKHLKQVGAKMYATFWCGVCRRQEQRFGKEALRLVNIIECDPRGKNAQPQLCQNAGVRAYPTWEINGQLYEGGMPLETLADLSGYQGSRNFSD